MCTTTDSTMRHITAGVTPPEREVLATRGQMLSTRCIEGGSRRCRLPGRVGGDACCGERRVVRDRREVL